MYGAGLGALGCINPLNAELNPICHLLALLGGATIVDVSRLRVKNASPTGIEFPCVMEVEGYYHRVHTVASCCLVRLVQINVRECISVDCTK
jgi:hypothetical protein